MKKIFIIVLSMEMHYQGEISMVVFEKWNKKGTKVFGIY